MDLNTPSTPTPSRIGELRRLLAFFFVFTAFISLAVAGMLIKRHLDYQRDMIRSTKSQLVSLTFRAAQSIDSIVRDAVDNADSIAAHLSSGVLNHESALAAINDVMRTHNHFFNSALSYAPYAFDPSVRLFSRLYVRKNAAIDSLRIEDIYDYADSANPKCKWFCETLARGPYWSQPFYAAASKTLLVTYSVPFYGTEEKTGKKRAKGAVTFSISMEEIKSVIESLDLGPTGFGALVSGKGAYLYHPDINFVLSGKTLAQTAAEFRDKDRLILAKKAENRESGILDHHSISTGLNTWLIFAPIAATGWSMQNTFVKDDINWDVTKMRRRLIWIVVFSLAFVISAAISVCMLKKNSAFRLWSASSICAICCAVGIGMIWRTALTCASDGNSGGMRIGDRATLNRVSNAFVKASAERHTEPPVFIPTGIYLETASLSMAGDFSISGYLWQKYKLGSQDSLHRGFVIGNTSDLKTEENYRIASGGYETVRWHFSCTVPQNINREKYPLDKAVLTLRIMHKELNHNVFLVPDLPAYSLLNPASFPGLAKGLALPGWKLAGSYFELRKNLCNTNFGLARPFNKENFPSFHFTVVAKRIFLDAFISNLTAIIIVGIILFTLLLITSRNERLVGFMQAGCGRILNICVSMFLVIAFSHIDVRRRIVSEQIFYLEYFYFFIYLAILMVCVNSVVYSIGKNIPFIQYRENLIVKLCFWPFLFGSMFLATACMFY